MSKEDGGAGGGSTPMDTAAASKTQKRKSSENDKTETSSKLKMNYIRNNRGLFKDHHPIYEDLTKKEYPVLLQSAQTTAQMKVPMNILQVNKVLKNVNGVQYVKAAGSFYVKVFFGCASDANKFLLDRKIMNENGWLAKVPYDSIESQGIIRAPVELSEEQLLEDLQSPCMILGVKRFSKKQANGEYIPLQTVLVTFKSSMRPDHVIFEHIWMPVLEYIKPLLQCFKCYKFGHGSGACKSMQVCSICSAGHFYRDCTNPTDFKCSNCSGPHSAVSYSCSVKAAKIAEVKNKINGKFTYATAVSVAVPTGKSNNNKVSSTNSKPTAKTPQGRALIVDIINSDIVLEAITKTIVDLLKKKDAKDPSASPISAAAIKQLLVTNFSI